MCVNIKNCQNCMDQSYTRNLFGKIVSMCHATGEQKDDLSKDCEFWREKEKSFNTKDYDKLLQEIIFDKSTSFFIREAIVTLEKRDIVDIMNDLEVLQSLYQLKLETMLKKDGYFVFKDSNK